MIALGSNRRHARYGDPRSVLQAALAQLAEAWAIVAISRIVTSAPIGPSRRRYANAAAVIEGPWAPREALARLQAVERAFGRRRRGQRWSARVLDLDLLLWDGGCWHDAALVLPHPQFRERTFVLGPAAAIAPSWRDPVSGRTLRQLAARGA